MGGYAGNAPIVTDGLVLYLDAGNDRSYPGSGTTWADISGNSRDFTAINGAELNFQTSPPKSFFLDGINDYFRSYNTSFEFQPNEAFTIQMWVKYNGTINTNEDFISNRGALSSLFPGWVIRNRSATSYRSLQFIFGNGSNQIAAVSSDFIFWGSSWHLVTLTYDGGGDVSGVKAYANTTEASMTPQANTLPASLTYSSAGTQIGASTEVPRYANCYFGQVLIYNKSLSVDEITQNYNALKNRFL